MNLDHLNSLLTKHKAKYFRFKGGHASIPFHRMVSLGPAKMLEV